jgi:FADH2 O2-dependent halogenase
MTVGGLRGRGPDGIADVVVVGGGPAGSTVATLLGRAGYEVVLVERHERPRDHVGELILPSVNMILHRMGLLETVDGQGFVRREGLAWTGPCTRPGEAPRVRAADFPPPRALRRYGYNVERSAFDHLLQRAARDAGVRLESASATRVVFDGEHAIGVTVSGSVGSTVERGRFVVDATGRRCLVASQLGLRVRDSSRRQCAIYTWVRGADYAWPDGFAYAFVHRLHGNSAWAWQIPLREGLSSVGLVMDAREIRAAAGDYDTLLRRIIRDNPALEPHLSRVRRERPWIVEGDYSYQVARLSGPGWLLVGDAAGFIDPIFASGVDIAMHSAFFAYQALVPLLRLATWTPQDEAFQLREYEARLIRGTTMWRRLVEAFYDRPDAVATVATDERRRPGVARVVQGNLYDLQNLDIAEELLAAMTGEGLGGGSALPGQPSTAATVTVQMRS